MSTVHRLAVIGAGIVSGMHFRGYLDRPDRVEVVAAVDPVPERRAWVESTFGITTTYASIAELLDAGSFEVAVVCTPSHVRRDAIVELAKAGKHLFVEKPLADGIEEAREVVEIARQAEVKLAVDQNFRDHYAFGLARDAIRAGRIGRVLGIDQSELTYRTVAGWRARMAHNALSVMGVHWFDGFRQLLDADADWLVARTYSSPAMGAAGETDAFVQIRFGDATVNYTQSFSSRVERCETVVIGETGTLRFDYDHLEIHDANGVEVLENPFAGDGKPAAAFRELDQLLVAIETGGEPGNSGVDNLKTLSLLAAAYRSAETGEPVTFTEGLI